MSIVAQQALLDAILGRGEAPSLMGLAGIEGGARRGLQAYRSNAKALAARSLASVYPRLEEIFGEDDFAAMAWAFWRTHPPRSGDLADWGGELAEFLAAQEGMDTELLQQAGLDWALHEAARAEDADFNPNSLALLTDGDPSRLRLLLRPGTAIVPNSDGAWLVWRRGWRAERIELDAASARFMQKQLDGASLAASLEEDLDFATWLQESLRQGWLIGVEEL